MIVESPTNTDQQLPKDLARGEQTLVDMDENEEDVEWTKISIE